MKEEEDAGLARAVISVTRRKLIRSNIWVSILVSILLVLIQEWGRMEVKLSSIRLKWCSSSSNAGKNLNKAMKTWWMSTLEGSLKTLPYNRNTRLCSIKEGKVSVLWVKQGMSLLRLHQMALEYHKPRFTINNNFQLFKQSTEVVMKILVWLAWTVRMLWLQFATHAQLTWNQWLITLTSLRTQYSTRKMCQLLCKLFQLQ